MVDFLRIKRLFLGNCNAYIVAAGHQWLLVDGGLGERSHKILATAATMGLKPKDLKYIFITHAHYDHVGSVNSLKKICDKALVIAHEKEVFNLESGLSPVPNGTMWFSRPVSWLGCLLFKQCIKFFGIKVDISFNNIFEDKLSDKVVKFIHTPGHTSGSAVLLVDGALFCGDTVFHLLPDCFYPPFADDENLIKDSWKTIIDCGAKTIYPGHGRKCSVGLLKKKYDQIY